MTYKRLVESYFIITYHSIFIHIPYVFTKNYKIVFIGWNFTFHYKSYIISSVFTYIDCVYQTNYIEI